MDRKTLLIKTLKKCKIKKGDTLLIHSDISQIDIHEADIKSTLNLYHSALKEIIGKEGTICVPAFNYEYSRKKIPFDLKKSPVSKELGLFSTYISNLSNSHRSINPITSIAAIGKKAKYICGGKTGSSYGVDSAWDRMNKINAKMVFIGVDTSVMTFPHYVEHIIGVPHIYNKIHNTPVYLNGKSINIPIVSQVRYLNFGIEYRNDLTKIFERARIIDKAKIGNSFIRVVSFSKMFNFLQKKIQKDFFYYLKKNPNFNKLREPIK